MAIFVIRQVVQALFRQTKFPFATGCVPPGLVETNKFPFSASFVPPVLVETNKFPFAASFVPPGLVLAKHVLSRDAVSRLYFHRPACRVPASCFIFLIYPITIS